MAKEFFKDLPDTTTPLTATRLNGLLDGEEVIGNIVVDSIRTKNIFGNYTIINGWIAGTTLRVALPNGNRMAFVSCKPNTTYTISRSVITSTFRVSDYTTIPTMTSSNVDYTIPTAIENNNGTTITYTTSSTAKYLIIHYGREEESTSSDSLATIQVEEGSTASTYTHFQNLDGYDNYSTNETRIGTWINGKPIYRKIITKTSFTVGETTNTHGISNIDFIVNVRGVGIRTNGEQEFLPTVVPPSGMQYYQISIYDVTKTQYRMYMGSYTQAGNQKLETLYLIFEYTKTTD